MGVHVKGLVLRARMDYVEKRFGEAALSRVIAEVPPESRAALRADILVSSWYPLSTLLDMAVTLDRLYGKGDLELSREMGRNAAQVALQGVHRNFAKEHDPGFVIRMLPLLWGQYYDSGRLETESTGPESSMSRIFDMEELHRVICLGMIGWTEAALEIWGGQDRQVKETKCRVWGDDFCEFISRWTDPLAMGQRNAST
jgi:hypothetical protein